MITIKDFMETVDYRITEGSDYCWDCFGPHAYRLDSWNGEHDGHTVGIVFDVKNQTVYQAEVHDYQHGRSYRWTNPDYIKAHGDEVDRRQVVDTAYDDVKFIDLEVEDDFLSKARAIVTGEDYDTRVSLPIEFTDEEMLQYMMAAHERDITFNQFVEQALIAAIEEHKLTLPHVTNTDNPIDFPVTKEKKNKKKGK